MPLTFPAHLAPVLALKVWRPRWCDGVALSTGAVAPDVAYLAAGPDGRTFADTHTWPALFWWCLPVALAYAAVLGAASHVGWDWLTHTDDWLRVLFGIDWSRVTGVAWWTVSDLTSTVVGSALAVVLAARLGRRGERETDGLALPARRPTLFWGVAGLVAVAGAACVAALPGATLLAPTGVRLIHVAGLALLAGGLAVKVSSRGRRGVWRRTAERTGTGR
ncbi:DUF4184 family protein [Micromonospora craniellae]|uniref:DUF4184 family protein n=1 Tax=Micromonospora craniellae TaxID=2294034 RepID=A0A372FZQ0_9ACTN|nr:DUF4184 family protein [Micromonospora craniellae]QOC91411.1 DUF4184 family protein [Micromonospora craniellae]RFS46265.1 DUF4184 family protein [Micromonospora craniellae]